MITGKFQHEELFMMVTDDSSNFLVSYFVCQLFKELGTSNIDIL